MAVAVVSAQVTAQRLIGPDARIRRSDWSGALATARAQTVMGAGRAASVVYTALPITIVQIFAPGATAVFAASERLMRMGLQVLGVIPQRLQSWIGSGVGLEKAKRAALARRYMPAMGVVAGLVFALSAPAVSHFVFSGAVSIPYRVSCVSGFLMALIVTSTSLGLSLVAQRQSNDITRAILPSAVVGVVAIGPLAATLGPAGGVLGESLAEMMGIFIQRRRLALGRPGWLDSLRDADVSHDLDWK